MSRPTTTRRIAEFLLKPFGENLGFFLILWLLASSADVYYWSIHGNPVFGCYMGIHGFIQVYAVVLLCGFLKGKALRIAKIILIILGIISMVADACVHRIMWFSFTRDMVAIILGSNMSEASEFLPLYLNGKVIGFVAAVLSALTILLLLEKKISALDRRWIKILMSVGLILSVAAVTVRKSNNWEGVFLNKIYLFLSYKSPIELENYRQDVSVVTDGEQPANIVVIIGESLSRRHCSLYGYDKETTPLLDGMFSDSEIIRYSDVEAAFTNTVEAFVRMFTEYDNHQEAEARWYDYIFLEDALSAAGYKTTWISNQSSVGITDNVVAKIAGLSDDVRWVGPKGMGIGKSNHDEDVIPYIQSYLGEKGEDRRMLVVHLMGSHAGFSTRYPSSFSRFGADDYPEAAPSQRQLLSEYDNSVLYSDWIVSSIMHEFDDEEAVVLFFPDHSLDIFNTDPDYIGHARTNNPASVAYGKEIPFIAYPTRKFIERFPQKAKELKDASERHYSLEDLPYTIMDLAGIISVEGRQTKEKSLLQ